jgi:hypothetical protein
MARIKEQLERESFTACRSMQAHEFKAKIAYLSIEAIMGHDIKTVKQAGALVLHTWRAASGFFLSIELLLMLLVAFATVGGVWLAVLGSPFCVPAFGIAGAYLVARPVLHLKRILAWPFM